MHISRLHALSITTITFMFNSDTRGVRKQRCREESAERKGWKDVTPWTIMCRKRWQRRMQEEEEGEDERGGVLMCCTSFCMNGISQEDKCVAFEAMTCIQGNYEHVWLPKGGMWAGWDPHTNHHLLGQWSRSSAVDCWSQSSSRWTGSGTAALRRSGGQQHLRECCMDSSISPKMSGCKLATPLHLNTGDRNRNKSEIRKSKHDELIHQPGACFHDWIYKCLSYLFDITFLLLGSDSCSIRTAHIGLRELQ